MSRLTSGKVEPYLAGLPRDFLDDFCVRQKDVAYTWRNLLAPAGSKANPPVFSKSYLAFTNQMGLGTIEFLLTSGKEVLDYLRNLGQEMQRQPYRRTEIKDEHTLEIVL